MNNISEAAKRLNISQTSKAIASIEDELGVALFDRKGRHIYLNRYGELMNYIDSAFRELNEGERIIKELTGIESGQVTFAVTFPHVMPLLIQNYVSRHPNIKIKQYQAISERAII